MKIDTLIDIARMKRETDIDWSGKKNGNYIRLIYVLMLYKEEYEVETVSEILDSGAPVWQTNWLRLPKGGKKNLVLFLELLHEFKFWDFYKATTLYVDDTGRPHKHGTPLRTDSSKEYNHSLTLDCEIKPVFTLKDWCEQVDP